MKRYANAKECMEKVTARKRVCYFGPVRCECEAAMECPAKREVDRLMDELAKLRSLCLRVACLGTTPSSEMREHIAAAGRGEGV